MTDSCLLLNTGASIPALGLGTWQSPPGDVKKAVSYAIRSGYRHIDCAFVYNNEGEVGEGIKEVIEAGIVRREDLFIATKVWCTFSSRVGECLEASLKSLGLTYVDLYLVHWPVAMNPKGNDIRFPTHPDGSRDLDLSWSHIQTWKQMERVLETGKTKAIGVSNYSLKYLRELLQHASICPAVNQIENHPCLPQPEIAEFCKLHKILVTAYSPLGGTGSPLASNSLIEAIAAKHRVPVTTILLSYHKKRGMAVLAKSVTPSRIDQNKISVDLDDDDMKSLETVHRTTGLIRYVYPEFGVDFGFPDKMAS